MKVFIIGGTGLLGSEGARELLSRGHEVRTLARRKPSKDAGLPEGMEIISGNYMDMTDDELREYPEVVEDKDHRSLRLYVTAYKF